MAISKTNKALFRAQYGEALYDAIMAAENVIVTVDDEEKWLADVLLTLALKSEIPDDTGDLTNGAGYQTAEQVAQAINQKIAAVYKPAGSCAFEALPDPSAEAEGNVYNITNAFTTNDKFLEGAGKKYKAGADVGIVAVKEGGDTKYMYNVFANFVDLTGYVEKVADATPGNIAAFTSGGGIGDSGEKLSDYVKKEQGKGLSTNDYDAAEKQKVADAYAAKHEHSNKAALDSIDSAAVAAWNSAGHVYASPAKPEGMKSGDLWLQTFPAE